MSIIDIGSIVEVMVVPYDITKNPNIKAEDHWSPYNYQNIVNNFDQIKETVVVMVKYSGSAVPIPELVLNSHITASWFCALDCLAVGQYDASVLMASISVESILNHDMRLEAERQKRRCKWLYLNAKNLELAYKNGLPTNLLFNTNENFQSNMIEFIHRRNKIAHGDLYGYSQFYPLIIDHNEFEDVVLDLGEDRPTKEHATDQINKAKNFIIKWAKSQPKIRLSLT